MDNGTGTVCVIGGANLDIEGRIHGTLTSSDSNPGSVVRSAGGVARNIAENLSRLGVYAYLITALGRDTAGLWLAEETKRSGVDVSHALWTERHGTATYLSVMDSHGELVIAVNDMTILNELDSPALEDRNSVLQSAQAIVIDCNLNPASLEYITHHFHEKPLFADPVSAAKAGRISPFLSGVHTLKPNRAEAELLSGITIDDDSSVKHASRELLRVGVRNVVISLGARGLFFHNEDSYGFLSSAFDSVTSVTGAGDALMAGLVDAHLRGLDLEHAARFALAASQLAVASGTPVAEAISSKALEHAIDKQSLTKEA